jgi:signal transduction histidine kinase
VSVELHQREFKASILLVDDQEVNLLALQSTLEGLGQNLVIARSGRDALKYLLEHDCALIILDVLMPDLDGFETAQLIREREACRQIPIIFLTAGDRNEAKVFKGYSVGAVDYIHKPFHPEVLRSKAHVFVELAKKTELIKEQERQLRETEKREHEAKAKAALELAETRARLLSDLEAKNEELEQANVELEIAKLRAERESKFKSRFLAGMSHELRTPLNAVIGFSEMLEQELFGPLNTRQKDYVSLTLHSGRHLLALVNDILDISKVEAGRMDFVKVQTTIQELVPTAMEIVQPLATRQGVSISLSVPPTLPPIDADPLRLKQVLYNLLSNAIKFTPGGGMVALGASVAEGFMEIRIEDTGVGIKREDMHRLFREFERIENPINTVKPEGTGLGLALSQRLVHLHGGTIQIDSEVNKGTTVRVRLPLPKLPPVAETLTSAAEEVA